MGLFLGAPDHLPNIFRLPTTTAFGRQLFTTYHLLIPAFLGVLWTLFGARHRWKAAAVLLGCLGWVTIVLPTFNWGPVQFYIESYYLLLGYMLAIPLVLDVFPLIKPRILSWSLAALVVYRVAMIVHVSSWFVDRYDYLEEFTEGIMAQPDQRYFLHEGDLWKERFEQFWAVPFEFAMISAAKDPARVRTLFAYGGDGTPEHFHTTQRTAFTSAFGPVPYIRLDQRYFPFSDTTTVQVLPRAAFPE